MILIGDIHGCFLTFETLLKKLPDDEIFLVGDFIDRGPRSKQVVEFLIKHPEIKSVMGNHEFVMADSEKYDERSFNWWMDIGFRETLESYSKENMEIPEEHWNYIAKLPTHIEKEGVFISHSIVKHSLEKAIENLWGIDSILWARDGIRKKINKCFHIFGHTPRKEPLIRGYWANIDTGCVFGGKLTALQYPSMKIFQQDHLD